MEYPKLDRRLAAVASLVRPGKCVADVGTDHGYLVCNLVGNGICPSAIASDCREKPLDKAREAVYAYGLKDRVTFLLCDGLLGYFPGSAQDIVIAGMGGETIWEILSACPWIRDPAVHLVLQPMTKQDVLRAALCEHGFAIECERAVAEGNFVYTVLSCFYTGEKRPHDLVYDLTGEIPKDSSPEATRYLERVTRTLRQKIDGIAQRDPARAQTLREVYHTIIEMTQKEEAK